MSSDFRREYLVRLPLPMAQLYCRAHNAKDGLARHNNCFYLFEALIKLAGCPMVAAYVEQLKEGGESVEALDRLLVQLSLPSLGQWVGILRETARYFGQRDDADTHPVGHIWKQLNDKRNDLPGMLGLFKRIKNGPEGKPAGDKKCSVMQLIDALVTYRNAVFGHGASREASFYEEEMGPLMFPAVNDLLSDGVLDLLGPSDSRLVLLTEVKSNGNGKADVELRELIGLQSERAAPISVDSAMAEQIQNDRLALLWPGRQTPVMLDPLLAYTETEITEDVMFLNRDRGGKQVEFLSYATGATQRDKEMAPTMNNFLGLFASAQAADVNKLKDKTVADKPAGKDGGPGEADEPPEMGDYEILAELGRGGMGVVYLARQLSLGRIVALKMLPQELAKDDTALLRFRREMRALGRIEHPNVIKVISCGEMPGGELYYAMEYVPGTDLEQAWVEWTEHKDVSVTDLTSATWSGVVLDASRKLHEKTIERTLTSFQADKAKSEEPAAAEKQDKPGDTAEKPAVEDPPKPPEETKISDVAAPKSYEELREAMKEIDLPLPPLPELPQADDDRGGYVNRIAELMRDAALALHTVHEQGFVHRDVKPANLMLTPDGERVVLMDFGLAKGEGEMSEASKSAGFVGTLRYAAPEQLSAAKDKVGPPADVRGLGVTMWELLTRQKAFGDAEDEMQLSRMVLETDLPRLRAIDPDFDKDLEAIVARATERRAEDRIQSAQELASYIDLYLEGKPLPIRTPTLTEMIGRWVREHKPLVATMAGATGLVIITVIVAFILINNARIAEKQAKEEEIIAKEEERKAKEQERAAKLKEREAKEQEKAAKERERTAKNSALEFLEDARLAADEWLINLSGDLQYYPGLKTTRDRLLEQAAEHYRQFAHQKSDDRRLQMEYARSGIRLGDILQMLGSAPEAEQEYLAALREFEQLGGKPPSELFGAAVEAPDPPLTSVQPSAPPELTNAELTAIDYELANCQIGIAIIRRDVEGRREEALKAFAAALLAIERLLNEDPRNLDYRNARARTELYLADTLRQPEEVERREQLLRASADGFRSLAEDDDSPKYRKRFTEALILLGYLLDNADRDEEAAGVFSDSVAAYDKIIKQFPTRPDYYSERAAFRVDLANSLRKLGRDGESVRTQDAAVKDYQQALVLVSDQLDTAHFGELVGLELHRLAVHLNELGYNELAYAKSLDATKVFIDLLNEQPAEDKWRYHGSLCQAMFARVLGELADDKNAEAHFLEAVAKCNELLKGAEDEPAYHQRLGETYLRFGRFLHRAARIESAKSTYEAAIGELDKVLESTADNHACRESLALALTYFGELLHKQQQSDEAEAAFRRALSLREELQATPRQRRDLASLLANCPDAEVRDATRAAEIAQQLVDESPHVAANLHTLGAAQFRAEDWRMCLDALDKAEAARPADNSYDQFYAAMAHWHLDDKEEAANRYQRAITAMKERVGNLALIQLRNEAAKLLGVESAAE